MKQPSLNSRGLSSSKEITFSVSSLGKLEEISYVNVESSTETLVKIVPS